MAALEVLTGGDDASKGFVLAVEGGRIDHAHHANTANRALDETVAFDQAIRKTVKFLGEQLIHQSYLRYFAIPSPLYFTAEKGLTEDTLVIVTADHSHAFTMAGYPQRGTI